MNFFKKLLIFFVLFSFFENNFLFSYMKTKTLDDRNIDSSFIIRSVFYPGLGQLYMGNRQKGITFLTFTTLFIVGSVVSYLDSKKEYKNYLDSDSIFDDYYYRDYSRQRDQMFVFLGLTFLVWVYNIFDISKDVKSFSKNLDGFNLSFDNSKKDAIISYSKIY